MPRRRDREEASLTRSIDKLQYLAGIMACCYFGRQYRKGGHEEDPGFFLIGFGAALLGVSGLGGIVGSLLLDVKVWCPPR